VQAACHDRNGDLVFDCDSRSKRCKDMSYFLEAIQELRSVPIPDYEDRVEDICQGLDDETTERGGWPPAFLSDLLNLLSDERFLSVRTSWHVLKLIKNYRHLISPGEAILLKDVLVAGYDKFGDWMGPYLASEILGKFYPDGDTLAILKKLGRSARSPGRELVPYGIETLARTTQDELLRDVAVRELKLLLENDSEPVRREAAASLKKLGKNIETKEGNGALPND